MLDLICIGILILYFWCRTREAILRENAILRLRMERILLETERENKLLTENL